MASWIRGRKARGRWVRAAARGGLPWNHDLNAVIKPIWLAGQTAISAVGEALTAASCTEAPPM